MASVILIPKPGRPPSLANLRPISLTSCVGKVAEHVIHNRISKHIEKKGLFPYNMVGFRPSLSTQDTMKLIKHQIIDVNTRDVRGILGLDLEKAFDNISHAHILNSISELGLGETFHRYVSSFLESRKATLNIGDLKSAPFALGPKGTPQGAVISPLLFNIAMCKLSKLLCQVKGISHTLYADDITIWCPGGSEGEVETALQEAIDQTELFLAGTGLRCSSNKSELLLYRPNRKGAKPKDWKPLSEVDIVLHTGSGAPIPRVDAIRVLGMVIESNGYNGRTIAKISTKTENMIRLINRVSNRRGGLREDNLLRLFHAFLMSHITYVAAMHAWYGFEKKKLETLIRKSIKRVLGIPERTSTERLMQLGVHNTLEEIIEAQETAQLVRLSSTPAGRQILSVLGLSPALVEERRLQLPDEQRTAIHVSPFPRNVHPQHNVGRRRARAITLLKSIRNDSSSVCFVDAAQYGHSARFSVISVNHMGYTINAASLRDSTPSRAEQVAIALALLDDSRSQIFTDSRSAVRAFASGSISAEAFKILENRTLSPHTITWFPAHLEPRLDSLANLNDTAHSRARALTLRAGVDVGRQVDCGVFRDALLTFNEVTKHYQLSRRSFAPPHRKLSRPQAITFRMLQTRSYPSLSFLSIVSSEAFESTCPDCGEVSNFEHMLWRCPSLRGLSRLTEQDWDSALRSSEFLPQLRAVQRAHDAAVRLGLPVPTWERPAALL